MVTSLVACVVSAAIFGCGLNGRYSKCTLGLQSDRLVCLDEIQRVPDLFPRLRALVDDDRRPGRYLILGLASREIHRVAMKTAKNGVNHEC